jgi:hypothetical protein
VVWLGVDPATQVRTITKLLPARARTLIAPSGAGWFPYSLPTVRKEPEYVDLGKNINSVAGFP